MGKCILCGMWCKSRQHIKHLEVILMSLKPKIKDWTFQVNEQTNRSEKEFDSNMSFLLIFIIYSCNLLFITRGTNLFEINRMGILFLFLKGTDQGCLMTFERFKGCFYKSWKHKEVLSLKNKIRLLSGNNACFSSKW